MDNNYNIWRLLWNSICISMTQDEVQQIISYAYPLIQSKIKSKIGNGKGPIPKIDTSHKNTYAMHSGEPEAEGEHAETSIA